MRAVEKKEVRGSSRWIRSYVNDHTAIIDREMQEACELGEASKIEWLSPLANDKFKEYGNDEFLKHLGLQLPTIPLDQFWPNRGPRWDALARTSTGEFILIEAKANIPEIVSSGTGASSISRQRIEKSLAATKEYLGVPSEIPWSGKLYQYANRIAHLYLIRELNQLPAHMVFVYFIGDEDVNGPKTIEEWKAAITVAKRVLGLNERNKLSKFIKDVYLDVRKLHSAT